MGQKEKLSILATITNFMLSNFRSLQLSQFLCFRGFNSQSTPHTTQYKEHNHLPTYSFECSKCIAHGLCQSAADSRSMGTLPEGCRCKYCGKNSATYIPDGCFGPVCFEPGGGCISRMWLIGEPGVNEERLWNLMRLIRFRFVLDDRQHDVIFARVVARWCPWRLGGSSEVRFPRRPRGEGGGVPKSFAIFLACIREAIAACRSRCFSSSLGHSNRKIRVEAQRPAAG